MHAHDFAKKVPGEGGIDHVAQREHRIGDGDIDAREANDPDKDANAVAEQATDNRQLCADSNGRTDERVEREGEFTQIAYAGFE